MAEEGTIGLAIAGAVATLTLDRPDKLNALTGVMLAALDAALDRIDRDGTVRAVILTGAGAKAFCAGADIAEWGNLPPLEFGRRWIRDGHRIFDRLARLRQPVIAAINGHALGGGLEIAAAADIRIAEAHAKFGLPEVRIGIVPGWSGTQRLVRRVGGQPVRRMALTGETIAAEEALRIGLVDEVVATGGALARAQAIATGIAERAPAAVQVAKTLINAAEGEDLAAGVDALAGALTAFTEDAKEGVAAFRGKRPPKFNDR